MDMTTTMVGNLASIMMVIAFVVLFIAVILYVIQGIILTKLNIAIYGKATPLAWVPICNTYLLGKLTVNKVVGIILVICGFILPTTTINGHEFSLLPENVQSVAILIYSLVILALFIYAIVKYFKLKKEGKMPSITKSVKEHIEETTKQAMDAGAEMPQTGWQWGNEPVQSQPIVQPVQNAQPQMNVEQPIQSVQSQMNIEQPVQNVQPQMSVEQPIQNAQPQMNIEQPVQSAQPQMNVEQPVQSAQPQMSIEQPVQNVQPQMSVEQPIQNAQPQMNIEQPVQSVQPQMSTEQPIQSVQSQMSTQQPLQSVQPQQVETLFDNQNTNIQ